jgi:hypothetical protein
MKKGLVVLLILAMTGATFAQEVTFSGQVEAGLLFEKQGDDDLTVRPYNSDSDNTLRADLTAKVTNDNYGAQLRIRSDNGGIGLHHAFVWGEFLNDIIKVSGGKIRGSVWGTDGGKSYGLDGVDGVRFEFKPVAGLDFGFALDAGAVAQANGVLTINQFFQETVLGVKYSSDLFNAVLAYKLDSDADDDDLSTDPTGVDDKEAKLVFGLNIKAVPALTAIVEGQLTHLGFDDSAIKFYIYEYFGFQLSDPFEAHLNFHQEGTLDDAKNSEIFVKPGLSFAATDAVTLKADLGFGIFTAEEKDKIEIDIQPGIEYAFSDTAKIDGWYKAAINPGGVKDSKLKNEVQIDFIWTF